MKYMKLFLAVALVSSIATLNARENKKSSNAPSTPKQQTGLKLVCTNPTAQVDLDVNAVRCRILTAGDLWWDYTTQVGKYEIPAGSGLISIYSGALWIGGVDQGGQLRVAGQEYGHAAGNNDFWPGPLDSAQAIDKDECDKYDKHFVITRKEVEDFVNGATTTIPDAIKEWPGNGDVSKGQLQYLAPFFDKNANGIYEPSAGDYPGYDLVGKGCTTTDCVPDDQLFGDKTIWWVFNDKGDVHASSNGNPIGLEIRAQAFGFSTNDEVNNMTFYDFRVINRSPITKLDSCYFGVFCDADLGNYQDDYVGCDVERGLGYTYNGDNDDDVSQKGYGLPPAIGIDFFRGPITNPTGVPDDGVDNNRNCQIDEDCEQAIMSKFVPITNGGGFPIQDPSNAVEYYNYLRGRWQDGTPFTYGGNGNGGGTGSTSTQTSFCFPGNTDHKYEWGTGGNCATPAAKQSDWSEVTNGGLPADRRMMQSAGPFTLLPGAVNVITTGVVWAQATSGGAAASVDLLRFADTKAQALFDNCFKIINGPDAPDLTIQELDKRLIIYLSNSATSNNYKDAYKEKDPYITSGIDTVWKFQGYKLYQLKDATVSSNDLENKDKARLVGIYDNKDGVKKIINYYIGQDPNPNYWTPKEMVNGSDNGVQHSIVVTTDLFSSGDPTLVNHKTYYYMAVAYGYNPGEVSSNPTNPSGYNLPYIGGRRNVKSYSAIPHIHKGESGGTEIVGDYGDGPQVKRIEGNGNGGVVLTMTTESINQIVNAWDSRLLTPTYEYNQGPIKVKIIDPLNVPDNQTFRLWFDTTGSGTNINNASWKIKNLTTGEQISSDQSIAMGYEQLLLKWGLSITIEQVLDPGNTTVVKNGLLGSSISSNNWLTGLADVDAIAYNNWIRSGTATGSGTTVEFEKDYAGVDNGQHYEGVVGGTWSPYRLVACSDGSGFANDKYYTGAGFKSNFMSLTSLKDLASVQVVFTGDKSKWTRSVVFEMAEDSMYAQNAASSIYSAKPRKLDFRRAPSVDKNGNPATLGSGASTNPNDANYISDVGMGWFPGYAINLETGERLNICFGENSALTGAYNQNGADMKWNPTAALTGSTPWDTINPAPVFGGQHYIYVFGHNKDNDPGTPTPNDTINTPRYDAGSFIIYTLKKLNGLPTDAIKREIFRDAMWVNIPLLQSGATLLSSDVVVKLNVSRSYKVGYSAAFKQDGTVITYTDTAVTAFGQNKNLPMYEFSTSGLATKTQVHETAVEALDIINVVPNPYYAYSNYETNARDNRVKITNLPESCVVSIYNLSGTLIRRYKKGEPDTKHAPKTYEDVASWHDGSIDWDLKNTAGIPISSGVYIIHVEVPGVGEKILKWFGVTRTISLDSF
jgi:hypothetical protein